MPYTFHHYFVCSSWCFLKSFKINKPPLNLQHLGTSTSYWYRSLKGPMGLRKLFSFLGTAMLSPLEDNQEVFRHFVCSSLCFLKSSRISNTLFLKIWSAKVCLLKFRTNNIRKWKSNSPNNFWLGTLVL